MKRLVLVVLAVAFCGCRPDSLREGLIAEYRLSGDALDSSGNGHDGVIMGVAPTADRHGVANGAMQFGPRRWIRIPYSPEFDSTTNAFTIALWAKIDRYYGSWAPFISHSVRSENRGAMALELDSNWGGMIQMGHSEQSIKGARYFKVSAMPKCGEWFFLAGTYDGSRVCAYLNGEKILEQEWNRPSVSTHDDIAIGVDFGQTAEWYFGALDDVMIWNRGLPEEEVFKVFETGMSKGNL